jgi:hypothetical protein
MTIVAPLLIGLAFVCVASLLREPHRRQVNAVIVGGAGAAYLSGGGFGYAEFAFTTVVTYCAYRGLTSWRWIGVAWLLHTGWDVAHHHIEHPIIPFAPQSSFGCAICDPVIALWCFAGGPSVYGWASSAVRGRTRTRGRAERQAAENGAVAG